MSLRPILLAIAAALCVSSAARAAAPSDIWPTLHRDNQRSGFAPTAIRGPYERKWFRDFHDELIASRVEAVVAEGKVFVGTLAGNLYALSVEDGSTVWQFATAGPIGHSATYHNGRVYVGSDDGRLYCLNAADGKPLWTYQAMGGIWVAPTCDGQRVYFGDRGGTFHAVSIQSGQRVWTLRTDGMILTPASISEDGGRIVFGSEDMHVYCVDPAGKLLWKSKKLQGVSLRDHGPTIWRGLAIVTTNPADSFHTVLGRNGDVLKRAQQAIAVGPDDKVLLDRWNDLLMKPTPQRRQAEWKAVIDYLKANPHDQTFYALSLEDGSEPWIAPVFYTAGLHNPPTAPTFNPSGGPLYVLYRTALTTYLRGVRRYAGLAGLDRESGLPTFTWPEQEPERTWYAMPLIGDEAQALSLMGDMLIGNHQGAPAAIDLKTNQLVTIWDGRDSYGGIFGPGAMQGVWEGARKAAAEGYLTGVPNEWHGPDKSIMAIAAGRMFWVTGGQVVCLGGPDTPRAASGGTGPPAPIKRRLPFVAGGGNVAMSGPVSATQAAPQITVTEEQVRTLVADVPSTAPGAAFAMRQQVRQRLQQQVSELVDDGPWAPFIVQLGISGEERHFWRTAQTMQVLAMAMPELDEPLKGRAKAYLDAMFAAGAPLDAPIHNERQAKRREPYDLGPDSRRWASAPIRYTADVQDLYAIWAYAHYADGWEAVPKRVGDIQRIFDAFAARGAQFDPRDRQDDAAEHLNAQIAGTIAYVRIMDRMGQTQRSQRGLRLAAELATLRVNHESDPALVRSTRVASKGLHQAKIPRYVELTPEVGALLRRYAGETVASNIEQTDRGLRVWYQAYGERLIGGENYISPPHLARGVFAAMADATATPVATLVAVLDQPWCKADLYYIEKLTAILRRAQ